MNVYTFNDKQGNRDRTCRIAIVHNGNVYSRTEAVEGNLAVFQELAFKKQGKWSNSDWRVTTNTAQLVVFMSPFDGWTNSRDEITEHVISSCKKYIGEIISSEVAWLAFQRFSPNAAERVLEMEEKAANADWTLL